jgi:hypothetical protein
LPPNARIESTGSQFFEDLDVTADHERCGLKECSGQVIAAMVQRQPEDNAASVGIGVRCHIDGQHRRDTDGRDPLAISSAISEQ